MRPGHAAREVVEPTSSEKELEPLEVLGGCVDEVRLNACSIHCKGKPKLAHDVRILACRQTPAVIDVERLSRRKRLRRPAEQADASSHKLAGLGCSRGHERDSGTKYQQDRDECDGS